MKQKIIKNYKMFTLAIIKLLTFDGLVVFNLTHFKNICNFLLAKKNYEVVDKVLLFIVHEKKVLSQCIQSGKNCILSPTKNGGFRFNVFHLFCIVSLRT